MIRVTAVVLAYREEPWLDDCVTAILASEGVEVDVVVVDNGCETDVAGIADRDGVTMVDAGRNLGFAGGCNLGATKASGDVLAFINSDALVKPDALAELAAVATRPGIGIATASIRLAREPDKLNSGGNDIHFLGFSWAGRFGEREPLRIQQRPATGASGAGMALTRERWDELGGFSEDFFAYHEDVELSWRCWMRGVPVVYVPSALVYHHYEFSRNSQKSYLLERNRLLFLATCYERRTLILLAPALVATEIGVVVLATVGGWLPEKARGWAWLWRHRSDVRERRAWVQRSRLRSDRDLSPLLVSRLNPQNFPLPRTVLPLDRLLDAYWWLMRRAL